MPAHIAQLTQPSGGTTYSLVAQALRRLDEQGAPSRRSDLLSAAEVKTKRMLHARPRLYMHIGP